MKILLAEDEKKLRDLYKKILEMKGHEVAAVDNGLEALEQALTSFFDLIITDVMMPTMDGYTFVRKMRESGNNTQVIILTAMGQEQDKIEGLSLGADEYLVKPVSLKELQARVDSVNRRQTKYKPVKVVKGNTTLDMQELELTSVNSVSLTYRERRLLSLLLQNENKIIDSNTLAKNIWKEEVDTDEVFLLVSFLQTKLKHIKSNLKIKGDFSSGYALCLDD